MDDSVDAFAVFTFLLVLLRYGKYYLFPVCPVKAFLRLVLSNILQKRGFHSCFLCWYNLCSLFTVFVVHSTLQFTPNIFCMILVCRLIENLAEEEIFFLLFLSKYSETKNSLDLYLFKCFYTL